MVQMVACFLSMEEVPGSIPGKSSSLFASFDSDRPTKKPEGNEKEGANGLAKFGRPMYMQKKVYISFA